MDLSFFSDELKEVKMHKSACFAQSERIVL